MVEVGAGWVEEGEGTFGALEGESVVIREGFARAKVPVSGRHLGEGATDA